MIRSIIQTYRSAFSGLTKNAWILGLCQFVNSSGMMVMFYLTLYMTQKLHFSIDGAGRVMGLYGAGSLVGAYIGGWLSDRIDSLHVQKAGLIVTGLSFIAMGQVDRHLPFAILTMMAAIGNGSVFPAVNTSIARILPPENRAKGYALNRLAVNLGVSIGPVVGGYLALHNYRSLFWADGLTCLAAAGFYLIMFRHFSNKPVAHENTETPARSPWRDFQYLAFLGLIFITGIIFIQLFSTFPLYMKSVYGFLENRIGQLMAINTLLIVIVEMVLLEKVKHLRREKVIAFAFLLLGLGFALMPLGRGFLFASFTVGVWTFGEMLSMPLAAALIADRAGEQSQGRYMGLFSLAFSSALVVGPLVGTGVYRNWGPNILWLGCGILGLLMYLTGLRIGKKMTAGGASATAFDKSL